MRKPVVYSRIVAMAYNAFCNARKASLAVCLLAFGSAAVADEIVIVAFGDSLTHGYGLPAADGFVPQLQDWLRDQGEDVRLINAGVSGDTTSGGLARLGWVLSDDVDAVILELGGNDMLRGIAPVEARRNLAAILSEISARGVPVLVAGMLAPPNYGAAYKADFDAIYPELSSQYGAVYYRFFLQGLETLDRQLVMTTYMQADGIHPNAAGVSLVVADIGPSVRELIAMVD